MGGKRELHLRLSSGADTLFAGDGDYRLVADDLSAGAGEADTLDCGAGRDRLEPGEPVSCDLLSGGDGTDLADYIGRADDLTLSIGGGPDDGGPGEGDEIAADVERLRGGDGDVLVGDNLGNHLDGGPGADDITGGLGSDHMPGSDSMLGGSGADHLEALGLPAFADQLTCGSGVDTHAADGNDVVEGDCE